MALFGACEKLICLNIFWRLYPSAFNAINWIELIRPFTKTESHVVILFFKKMAKNLSPWSWQGQKIEFCFILTKILQIVELIHFYVFFFFFKQRTGVGKIWRYSYWTILTENKGLSVGDYHLWCHISFSPSTYI